MERIDALIDEHREIRTAFRHRYDGRQLMDEQREFRAKLSRGEPAEPGMPVEIMLSFPGMPNYKGPVS